MNIQMKFLNGKKDEVLERRKTKNDDYLALEAIDKVIKLQK